MPKSSIISPMKPARSLLFFLMLLTVACGQGTPTPVPATLASPTLAALSPSPTATETSPAPTATPTMILLTAALTAEVNVRSGPGTAYESLGVLPAGETVQINLQSNDGQWYRILYPNAPDGYGWVSARYVRLAEPTSPIATIPNQPIPHGIIYGRVLQHLNVRTGPGTSFESIGLLEGETWVVLKGKNASASWFQIEYPFGTDGRGWVTAQYIQTDGADRLPVLDEYGTPVSTGTPSPLVSPVPPTPTIGPAPEDGDSLTQPSVRIVFSGQGTRQFTYADQVSAPEGDREDWIEFTPFATLPATPARLLISLTCAGSNALSVEVWSNGAPLQQETTFVCGSKDQLLTVPAGVPSQIKLSAVPDNSLRLVNYSVTIKNLP